MRSRPADQVPDHTPHPARHSRKVIVAALANGVVFAVMLAFLGPLLGEGPGLAAPVQALVVFLSGAIMALASAAALKALTSPRSLPAKAPQTIAPMPLEPSSHLDPAARLEHGLMRAMSRAGRSGHRVAVVTLAIDQHDDLKRAMGDAFVATLQDEVSAHLRLVVRQEEEALKIAENRFGIILEIEKGDAVPEAVAARIARHFTRVLTIGAEQAAITLSMGIAEAPGTARPSGALLREAEVALFEARAQGGNRALRYQKAHDDIALARTAILRDFKVALSRREQLAFVYQPVHDVRERKIVNAEALLRWNHEIHGRLSAPFLVGLAREANMLAAFTRWTLEQALRSLSETPLAAVTVNISPDQLADAGAFSELTQAAREGMAVQKAAGRVHLDLESAILERPDLEDKLDMLARAGYVLTLDGFKLDADGKTGDIVALIGKIPLSALKLDARTISAFDTEAHDRLERLVQALAGSPVRICAKNVETPDQLLHLDAIGIVEQQGNALFGVVTRQTLAAILDDTHFGQTAIS